MAGRGARSGRAWPKAHIPFGSGPRLCPGRSLASLETRVALATLYKNFDVERVAGKVTEHY
ncbi:MAG: cytochrome P450, partial [Vicinamibacterales bacterium]